MIRDQAATAAKRQVGGAGYTEVSGEETVESTSTDIQRLHVNRPTRGPHQIVGDHSSYLLSALEEYNTVSAPYWPGVQPSYNPQQTLL